MDITGPLWKQGQLGHFDGIPATTIKGVFSGILLILFRIASNYVSSVKMLYLFSVCETWQILF